MPGMTLTALAVWFQTSPSDDADFILAPDDRDDVTAYIGAMAKEQIVRPR